MARWRNLVQEVWDGALHMTDDDKQRIGMSQVEMLRQAADVMHARIIEREIDERTNQKS